MNDAELTQILRDHLRLTGSMKGNFETWLADIGTLPRYRELIPSPLPGETKLLEIGCYQPSVGYYLHLGWSNVVGTFKEGGECTTEISYSGEKGASIRLVLADAEKVPLPVPDGWADVVVMMEVFEHFALDPMHALWEVNRVLKPGGRFVFSTPNAASIQLLHKIVLGRAPLMGVEFDGYSTNRHNRLYDAPELSEFLIRAGFEVRECFSRSYGHYGARLRERCFAGLICFWDTVAAGLSLIPRKPERGHFIFIRATKKGPPRERYPANLYFNAKEWPGMAEERARRHQESDQTR